NQSISIDSCALSTLLPNYRRRLMKEIPESTACAQFSPRASLDAISLKLKPIHLLASIEERVTINQKHIKYTPHVKLYDAFIALLAGAHGIVENNTRLRSDGPCRALLGGWRALDNASFRKRSMPQPPSIART